MNHVGLSGCLAMFLLMGCIAPPGGRVSAPAKKAPLKIDEATGTLAPPEIEVMTPVWEGFMRGINLGNGLDAPSIGEWGVVLDENHFKTAAAAGLDHVRLPVRFSAYTAKDAPYTIEESFFAQVDWAIEMAHKYNLNIIVDMHHYEEIMSAPQEHLERFKGMWGQIAARYKDEPASVAFELLNEPSDKLVPEILNPLMKETLALVRTTNPTRTVLVDGYFWANAEWLDKVDTGYMDENTVVTWHMYQPILFTHQGAPWMGPNWETTGVVFPGPPAKPLEVKNPATKEDWVLGWFEQYNTLPAHLNPSGPMTVYQHFNLATAFTKKTGLRTYLGEFGAMNYTDEQSRFNYISLVRKEAERRHIGWCYWDDGGANQGMIVQTGKWVDVVHKSLFD